MEAAEQLVAEGFRVVAEAFRAVNDSIAEARQHIAALEAEIAELDHAKASKRQVEELHGRVDALSDPTNPHTRWASL